MSHILSHPSIYKNFPPLRCNDFAILQNTTHKFGHYTNCKVLFLAVPIDFFANIKSIL